MSPSERFNRTYPLAGISWSSDIEPSPIEISSDTTQYTEGIKELLDELIGDDSQDTELFVPIRKRVRFADTIDVADRVPEEHVSTASEMEVVSDALQLENLNAQPR